jgi:putative FmdB family regulatory protein
MPIYEYRCNSCGSKKEHLQKISDAPISICPACGSNDYSKLISAAGFQLKGSGWYVTDFKNNKTEKTASKQATKSETATETATKTVDTSTNTDKKTCSTSATD